MNEYTLNLKLRTGIIIKIGEKYVTDYVILRENGENVVDYILHEDSVKSKVLFDEAGNVLKLLYNDKSIKEGINIETIILNLQSTSK